MELQLPKGSFREKLLPPFLCFAIPLFFAYTTPRAFLSGLEQAGFLGVLLLMSVLPSAILLQAKGKKSSCPYETPGGKLGVALFLGLSIALSLLEILRRFYS